MDCARHHSWVSRALLMHMHVLFRLNMSHWLCRNFEMLCHTFHVFNLWNFHNLFHDMF